MANDIGRQRNPTMQEPDQELGRHVCALLGHMKRKPDGGQVGLMGLGGQVYSEWLVQLST